MTDLAKFLRARLDEDEQVALRWPDAEHEWQNVGKRRITYHSGAYENVTAVDVSNMPMLWWERIYVKSDSNGLTDHIVRHDPARVLREVEAKRRILDLHSVVSFEDGEGHDIGRGCEECGYSAEYSDRGGWCETVRLLALPDADHPDYDESWRP